MRSRVESILEEALMLDVKIRASLIQKLIDSLDDSQLESEWLDLAEKRLEELQQGNAQGITWDSIKQNIKKA